MTKKINGKATKLSRRTFIVGTAAAGSGLALGFHAPFGIDEAAAQNANAGAEVNAWVVIKPNDTVVIRIARSEMGQGTLTGLAQLVAEELECDWKKVDGRTDHRRHRTSRASACGATCRPAAAAASAARRTICGAAAWSRA